MASHELPNHELEVVIGRLAFVVGSGLDPNNALAVLNEHIEAFAFGRAGDPRLEQQHFICVVKLKAVEQHPLVLLTVVNLYKPHT